MKYKVNQKLNISMRTGFHNSEVVDREVVISKIEGNMIYIKYPLKYGGHKEKFGYESDLDKLVNWYNERHPKLDDQINCAEKKVHECSEKNSMQYETVKTRGFVRE